MRVLIKDSSNNLVYLELVNAYFYRCSSDDRLCLSSGGGMWFKRTTAEQANKIIELISSYGETSKTYNLTHLGSFDKN